MKLLITLIILLVTSCNTGKEDQLVSSGPVFTRTVYIASPVQKVWSAITDPMIVSKYYLVPLGGLDPRIGGEIFLGMITKY